MFRFAQHNHFDSYFTNSALKSQFSFLSPSLLLHLFHLFNLLGIKHLIPLIFNLCILNQTFN